MHRPSWHPGQSDDGAECDAVSGPFISWSRRTATTILELGRDRATPREVGHVSMLDNPHFTARQILNGCINVRMYVSGFLCPAVQRSCSADIRQISMQQTLQEEVEGTLWFLQRVSDPFRQPLFKIDERPSWTPILILQWAALLRHH